jgi:2',3'-cyclic-nucleotide 2'-phosphodiesterase (5'-nucleotidase family)
MRSPSHLWSLLLALPLAGAIACGDDSPAADLGVADSGVHPDATVRPDATADAGRTDTGVADSGVDAGADAGPVDTGLAPQGIVLIHTNDEHSHMFGFGPEVDDFPTPATAGSGLVGGVKRRVAIIDQIRQNAPNETVLLQAGDLSMGTLFHIANTFIGVDLLTVSAAGYDAVTLGNHEFDFGVSFLAGAISRGRLIGTSNLGVFDKPIVISNIRFSLDNADDDGLAALHGDPAANQPLVRTRIIERGGVRVGLLGLVGLDAALVAPFKQPVRFSIATNSNEVCTGAADCGGRECLSPAADPTAASGFCAVNTDETDTSTHFNALVEDAASAVRELRTQNADLVVLLSHMGVDERELNTIETMGLDIRDAVASEEILLAVALDQVLGGAGEKAIDVIVGGHSHTALQAPLVVPMLQAGHNTYIVQAGANGEWVGKIRLTRNSPTLPWELDTDYSGLEHVTDETPPGQGGFGIVADLLLNQVMDGLEGSAAARGGDNLIFPGEQCDGTAFPGNSSQCAALIPNATAGSASCFTNRQLDTSACVMDFPNCGDSTQDGDEHCDGADLGGASCVAIGYSAGTLACHANCTFDTGACTPIFPSLLEIVANFGANPANPVSGFPIRDNPGVRGDIWFHGFGSTDFDVGETASSNESNLANLVTDAERWAANNLVPANQADPIRIALNANGVIRDGLYAGETGVLTLADLFRVLPLGVSPLEQTPGYPLIDFWLTVPEVKAGLELGVSVGLNSDSFWLDVSGIQVEYDLSLPAFDPANPLTTGRITKLTLTDPTAADWDDTQLELAPLFDLSAQGDPFLGNSGRLIHVGTSLYIGLFLEGFGLCPRVTNSATAFSPSCAPCTSDAQCRGDLGFTCNTTVGQCRGGPPAPFYLRTLVPQNSQEVKEFLALTSYVRNLPDAGKLPAVYNTAVPRRFCCVGTACPADGSRSCQ